MNLNVADAEDQQLYNNLQLLNSELCSLVDDKESRPVQLTNGKRSGAGSVLQELNHRVNELTLDSNAPQFEFHGFGCIQSLGLPKRLLCSNDGAVKNKSKSNVQGHFVARQNKRQPQKENLWHQDECGALAIEQSVELLGNCTERNLMLRLMDLFKSMHEHINSELPSHQLNSMPSDYVFDLPTKQSMPKGCNIRHQVQVLCTKLERFIARQRRILETNRHFDYTKYTECDGLLNSASDGQQALKQFTNVDLRQRNFQFISRLANDNAVLLEMLLLNLRERIKSAHIHVYVFNWEMDIEHRYSASMTARLEETNKRALALAAAEFQASQPREFSFEEKLIAKHYQLENVVSCAKENEDFLTALLQSPENYFPPEIIALCEPPKNISKLPQIPPVSAYEAVDSLEHLVFGGDILEVAPSSPPRVSHRSHVPKCNRG
ncbi:protein bag-of-marbles [Drosophila montana]|uniref:protein bag-of-marbles n=1 Tax=Drosophila montana TaxID=40370 RepID=UPI00313E9526